MLASVIARRDIARNCWLALVVALTGASACNSGGVSEKGSSPAGRLLVTNQSMIEAGRSPCPLGDEIDFFWHVFQLLPDVVIVYPSENYYYFETTCGGKVIRGNIRLDIKDRDSGIVHFAYYAVGGVEEHYKALSKHDLLHSRKIRDFEYHLSFRGKDVLFKLHDIPQRPCSPVKADEESVGNLMDESGLGFMLLYSHGQKAFKFILCHEMPGSVPVNLNQIYRNMFVDERTGFAFFKDEHIKRHLLIGNKLQEVRNNTYFDGPFDQLPENYLQGDKLRIFIEEAYPGYIGQVDRFGNSVGTNSARVVISPYELYVNREELAKTSVCAGVSNEDEFLLCFRNELERIRSVQRR
jgi:hypothetical protein